VPTLASDACLLDCLASLERQTYAPFQIVVVDNSGRGAVHRLGAARYRFRLLDPPSNLGFGEAINRAFRACPADCLAVLNDDAVAHPGWLTSLVEALEADPGAGMAASRVLLAGTQTLDSAGLRIARDGSSKQWGRLQPADGHGAPGEALIPSGCAALYARAMLDEIGGFDGSFFLYCEDTDLALRGHWAGWRCRYVPEAVVEHRYSATTGRASPLKAYLVERNRLRLVVRNFPASWVMLAPLYSLARYLFHLAALLTGRGKAGEFTASPWLLPWFVLKAHLVLLRDLPRLLRERAAIARTRKRTPREFAALLRAHLITLRKVAAQ
jgi:GT2 family glycosyltransferase